MASVADNSVDGFDVEDDDWLDDADDARAEILKPAAAQSGKPSRPAASTATAIATTKPASKPVHPRNVTKASRPIHTPLQQPMVTARSVEPEPDSRKANQHKAAAVPPPNVPTAHTPIPVVLTPQLPELPQEAASRKAAPTEMALSFMQWLQTSLANRVLTYNETGAAVHFTEEGMALVSPLIFKLYAKEIGPETEADITGLQVQREVIKAGWHRLGAGKINILKYQVAWTWTDARGQAVCGGADTTGSLGGAGASCQSGAQAAVIRPQQLTRKVDTLRKFKLYFNCVQFRRGQILWFFPIKLLNCDVRLVG